MASLSTSFGPVFDALNSTTHHSSTSIAGGRRFALAAHKDPPQSDSATNSSGQTVGSKGSLQAYLALESFQTLLDTLVKSSAPLSDWQVGAFDLTL